jgi:hypothetical protein
VPTKSEIRGESSWIRKCCLISLYHVSKSSGTKRPHKWKVADTAAELDYSIGYVSESILLARYSEKLDSCPNRETALKKLKNEQ